MSTREIYAFPTTLSILRKYTQKALCTKTPLSRGVTGKTFTDTENKTEKSTHFPTGIAIGNPVINSCVVGQTCKDSLFQRFPVLEVPCFRDSLFQEFHVLEISWFRDCPFQKILCSPFSFPLRSLPIRRFRDHHEVKV